MGVWIWIKFGLNWQVLKYFFKCLGAPCYLIVVSGGFLNKVQEGIFFGVQVSSSSSLLFNIEVWSAVRITSFSVRLLAQIPSSSFINILQNSPSLLILLLILQLLYPLLVYSLLLSDESSCSSCSSCWKCFILTFGELIYCGSKWVHGTLVII